MFIFKEYSTFPIKTYDDLTDDQNKYLVKFVQFMNNNDKEILQISMKKAFDFFTFDINMSLSSHTHITIDIELCDLEVFW